MAKKRPQSPSVDDHEFVKAKAFFEEFDAESDRAAVILGAARLDLILYQLIQQRLLPSAGAQDELLDGDSPLSTFSARINIAYRLGLIRVEVVRALHLIRRIRNSFAHELASSSLSTGAHSDRIRELVAPMKRYPAFLDFQKRWCPKSVGSGKDFRGALGLLVLRLDGCFENTDPLNGDHAYELVPPAWEQGLKNAEATG